jgi:hypothetical protein
MNQVARALVFGTAVLLLVVAVAVSASSTRSQFDVGAAVPVAAPDGTAYRVQPGHASPDAAAAALAEINRRSTELLRVLRTKYVRGAPAQPGWAPRRREAARRLLARYDPDSLVENSPSNPEGETSYNLDKGAEVALCLRAREPGAPIHPLGTLTFVALHELAHSAVATFDHPPDFWEAFAFLLREAAAAGIYTAPDFASAPVRYCGISIDYNPALDPGVDFFD